MTEITINNKKYTFDKIYKDGAFAALSELGYKYSYKESGSHEVKLLHKKYKTLNPIPFLLGSVRNLILFWEIINLYLL